jgi:hypothetical protein
MVWLSGQTCLLMDCCFSELGSHYTTSTENAGLVQKHYSRKACSRHDVTEVFILTCSLAHYYIPANDFVKIKLQIY